MPRFDFSVTHPRTLGTFHYRLHVNLDAAILGPAAFGGVARDRHALALADDVEAHRLHSPRFEVLRHRVRAALRESLVGWRRADIVGVACDGERCLAIAHHDVRDLVERAVEPRLDFRGVGVEAGIAGHSHANHVVRQLIDARLPSLDLAGEVLLQVFLLAVHIGADRAAGEAAADRADQHALRAAGAVGHGAQERPACRAQHGAGFHAGAVKGTAAAVVGSTASENDDACNCNSDLQSVSFHEYSARSSFAPSTIARIFASATSRGRYFMPQSGATITSSGLTYLSAFLSRFATSAGVSTVMSERSMQPTMIFLPGSFAKTAVSRFDCAVSIDTCFTGEPASSGRKE